VATIVYAPRNAPDGNLPHGFLVSLVGILTADPDAAVERDTLARLAGTALRLSAEVVDLREETAALADEVEGLAEDLETLDPDWPGLEIRPGRVIVRP
jgi:hypothetical protein